MKQKLKLAKYKNSILLTELLLRAVLAVLTNYFRYWTTKQAHK